MSLTTADSPTRESDGLALCVGGIEGLLLCPPSWGPPASHPSWGQKPRVAWVGGQGFSSPLSHCVDSRCRDCTRQGWSWEAWPCGELLLSPALQGSVSSTLQMGSPSDSLVLHFEISEGWAVMTGGTLDSQTLLNQRLWMEAYGFLPHSSVTWGNKCIKKTTERVFFPCPNKRINMYLMSIHLWHFLRVRRLVGPSAHSSWFVATGE